MLSSRLSAILKLTRWREFLLFTSILTLLGGLTAYQKQKQFGPASILVEVNQMNNVNTPYLGELESSIIDTSSYIKSEQQNVEQYLSTLSTQH